MQSGSEAQTPATEISQVGRRSISGRSALADVRCSLQEYGKVWCVCGRTFAGEVGDPASLCALSALTSPVFRLLVRPLRLQYRCQTLIGCDATDCKYSWFHPSCVGVDEAAVPAEDEPWLCPGCTGAGYHYKFGANAGQLAHQGQTQQGNGKKRRTSKD